MADWTITESEIGVQPIADTSTTQRHGLGKIVRARHETYGSGEFIYLKGLAGTAVGTTVDYDQYLGTTGIGPVTGGIGPVAVAMSANIANQYGWYQIGGAAVVAVPAAATVVPGAQLFSAAGTAGTVDDAVVASEQILNAKFSASATPAANFAIAQLNRPFHQGAIT